MIWALSNLIAELSLRTTWHVKWHLHVISARCVARDLHTTAPGPLGRMCWRQFAAQWGDCENLELRLWMRLILKCFGELYFREQVIWVGFRQSSVWCHQNCFISSQLLDHSVEWWLPARYRVSAGTGRPGVNILWLGKVESWICNFCLSVAARKLVWADPSLRYTSMLLGR